MPYEWKTFYFKNYIIQILLQTHFAQFYNCNCSLCEKDNKFDIKLLLSKDYKGYGKINNERLF